MRLLLLAFLLSLGCNAAEPRRIISTAPGITEIVFALGLGDRLVGATQYCVYPPEAKKVPRTGTWMSPNLEAVLAAKPDLVIVQKTAIHGSSKFAALKLNTIEVELVGVADIYTAIDRIGSAAGAQAKAAKLIASIRSGLDEIRKKTAGKPETTAMFIVGRSPGSLEGIIAVGKSSYQTDVMTIAGGRNILADSKAPYPKVLHEEILARDPDVIIDMGEHADAESLTPDQIRKEVALWLRYPNLKAVRNKRVHPVSSGVYVVPGPRVVELARIFARMLHPELFR